MDSINFPNPPDNNSMYMAKSYTSDGNQVPSQNVPERSRTNSLGANFSSLIGTNVTTPVSVGGEYPIVERSSPSTKKKKKSKQQEDKAETAEVEVVDPTDSRQIVENTVYSDSYNLTNKLSYNIIAQADELLRDCKQDLDYIRSQRSLKGKYHYTNATLASMSSLLSTKLQAVREINNTIKSVNDMEYRRFKDMRAMDQGDDNKALMDAYNAYISAPVGAPVYHQPNTMDMTAGLGNIIRKDYPQNVQANMDAGMANYLANLTPEENLMLQDNNPDIEEVIVYDEASGAKYFQWVNKKNDQPIPNMPASSELTISDYSIDPIRKIAKNINLNSTKRVIILNQGAFSRF